MCDIYNKIVILYLILFLITFVLFAIQTVFATELYQHFIDIDRQCAGDYNDAFGIADLFVGMFMGSVLILLVTQGIAMGFQSWRGFSLSQCDKTKCLNLCDQMVH